ncbi:chemotaxis protein CheW [Nakamurella deserti]|uniref:chemotaxis protein CheW n=1 Tax=Nakamurella deserti TaxID=2164074 RepID=UPI000DBE1865|nr:chemotaxis protein CheW [Nakamurella deserti]
MTGIQAVLLPVGAEVYALGIDWVREVVAGPEVAPLVTAPPFVVGLFNLRGQIVPLFDTAALLGVGRADPVPGAAPFAAVVETADGLAGLAASALPWRSELGAASGPSERPGTAGVHRDGDRVVVLLDPAALLTPERLRGDAREPAPSGAAPWRP